VTAAAVRLARKGRLRQHVVACRAAAQAQPAHRDRLAASDGGAGEGGSVTVVERLTSALSPAHHTAQAHAVELTVAVDVPS